MRCISVLAVVVVLALPASAVASHRILPDLTHEPLGALARDSPTIHVLRVKSVEKNGATFQVEAALKGKIAEAPFRFAELREAVPGQGTFRPGALVLCFGQQGSATLFVGGRWAVAVEPDEGRGEKHWLCSEAERFSATFEGTAEALREHLVAVLAGRETTLTARAPQRWGQPGGPRLWRIKASLKITDPVLSDESPRFVGWGTGDPDEVTKRLLGLRASSPEDRINAANDLARLGAAARPALPALRRAARGPDPSVGLAATVALARLLPDEAAPLEAVRPLLRHADVEVRSAAASALGDLGPRALPLLPALLRALEDRERVVRAGAATAVGQVAPGSPAQREAVAALASLVKEDRCPEVRAAVGALRRFGPHAWAAVPILGKNLSALYIWPLPGEPDVEAVALLARLSPPPVELLGEILEDQRSSYYARLAAVRQLAALGPRARRGLPSLRRTFAAPRVIGGFDLTSHRLAAAEALLAVDPEGAPGLVAPMLLERARWIDHRREKVIRLLGKCGAAGRPAIPVLTGALGRGADLTPATLHFLAALLGPEDVGPIAQLRRFAGPRSDSVGYAEVLWRLGHRGEGLDQAAWCLTSPDANLRSAAARWLGDRGRKAEEVEPALEKALAKATGAERTRLALTLWRARRPAGTAVQGRAFAALGDLLAVCEGKAPATGPIPLSAFWVWPDATFAWSQEDGAVGAAVALVHTKLEAGGAPVPVLAQALRDRGSHVRLAAAVALARAEPRHPETVVALQRLLERHPHFFCYAADTLAALGPRAAPVAPLLLPYLRHPDDRVYRAVDRVLRKMGPEFATIGWGAAGVPGAVPKDLGPLWDDLAGGDALRADLAVWRLAGAGPRAAALLCERLRPPPVLPSKRLAELIKELDSDDFATREHAQAELSEALESAAPALRRARPGAPLELRLRIDRLLAGLDPPKDPEQRRRLRALHLLEELGGPDARALLKRLARGGPGIGAPWEEAGAALRRLERP